MLKEKKKNFICIGSKNSFKSFGKNLTKNVAGLICKSTFDNTIKYLDIPLQMLTCF